MVKIRKIVAGAVCALCAVALSLPCFAQSVDVSTYSTYFSIWNSYQAVMDQELFAPDSFTLVNWSDGKYLKYSYVTVGLDFPMLPYLTYSVDFTLRSNNSNRFDWVSDTPVGNYCLTDAIVEPDLYGIYDENDPNSWRVTPLSELILDANHSLGTTFTPSTSTSGTIELSYPFRITLISKEQLSSDYMKLITVPIKMQSYSDSDRSFSLTLSGITIYYDPTDTGAATLDQVQKNTQELKDLGIQVNTVNIKVDQLSEQVTNEINTVKSQLTDSTNQLTSNIIDMQNSINSSISDQTAQQHQDSEKTQQAIKDQTQQQHQDAENAPNNEYDKAQEKEKELDKDVSDLQDKVNISGVTDSIFDVFKKFWSFLSSTDVQTSFNISPFSVNLPSVGNMTFWEGGKFDFSQWVNNDYWMYRLILLGKILSSIFLIAWAVRFVLDVIDYLLGNSKKSISQIIFGYNPFSRS